MNDVSSLNHSRWECKYHVVWIPKYRKKKLYGELRRYLGQVFKDLARARESEVIEGHLCSDHVHMLISVPPKYSVAQVIGFIKGKSAIHIARNYLGHRRNFTGQHIMWAGICRTFYASSMNEWWATITVYHSKESVYRSPRIALGCIT